MHLELFADSDAGVVDVRIDSAADGSGRDVRVVRLEKGVQARVTGPNQRLLGCQRVALGVELAAEAGVDAAQK